jgi:UDP-2,3-diacylglucosamine hydrolase
MFTAPAPAYLISDAHLGFATRDVERSLLRFLRHLHGRAGSLVINGDLFEFWFEWRHVMPRGAFRVLAALADLRDAGIPVLMIAGNHDCWGGDILREDVGVDFRVDPWEGELGGWRARVEHGDGLRGAADRGYRALRTVIRNPISVRLFRWLHPDIGAALATRTSHTSRNYQARDGGAALRESAARRLDEDRKLELLVYGHSHVAELRRIGRVEGGHGVYANAGSWLDRPTFLRLTPERIELMRWEDDSHEGVNLDSLDRVAEKPLP